MAKETTYAGMLGDWQRLLESLKANGEELAHLERSRTQLEKTSRPIPIATRHPRTARRHRRTARQLL